MSLNLLSEIRSAIAESASEVCGKISHSDFELVAPTIGEHGDLATNIALVMAQRMKREPMELALEIASKIAAIDWLKVEVKKPGFINFILDEKYLLKNLQRHIKVLAEANDRSEKIVIEHTNVNPNKAMHIGHLRNSILGDVIKRVLSRVGYTTEVQYYVNDTGLQVIDTHLGIKLFERQELKQYMSHEDWEHLCDIHKKVEQGIFKYDYFSWYVYVAVNAAYEKNPALLEERKGILHDVEGGNTAAAREVKKLARKILEDHLDTMADFKVDYDLLVWESDILHFKFWQSAFDTLKVKGIVVKEDTGKNAGCWVIKSEEKSADDEYSFDKVLVKSDGTATYTGKDLAYHLWKFNKLGSDFLYKDVALHKKTAVKFHYSLWSTDQYGKKSDAFGHADRVYNVIDVRQSYPQGVIKSALAKLGYTKEAERVQHIAYGVVSLSKKTVKKIGQSIDTAEKKVYSMSGRKGLGIPVDRLLEIYWKNIIEKKHKIESKRAGSAIQPKDIAVGAIKYFLLSYNPHSDIIFDFDNALSLDGNTGIYIQYAYARAAGIIDNAHGKKKETFADMGKEEKKLLKKLYFWPSILEVVADECNVNAITSYAYDLANCFNGFYEKCPVVTKEGIIYSCRLDIVKAFQSVMEDVLKVLGIEAPKKM